jgi:hypothetical protein
MRKLVELREEVEEVNYFLGEWQRLKSKSSPDSKLLEKPELHFICRTLEHLINDAEILDIPLVLTVQVGKSTKDSQIPSQSKQVMDVDGSSIAINQCLKLSNSKGQKISYVGNQNGLLSIARLAEMVASGSQLVLKGAPLTDWG